jgi:L-histidine N-alpha-methyltransferase
MSRCITAPTSTTSVRGFLADVVAGLQARPKTLPSKYFYDKRGSQLFDLICELPEYYPTRTEIDIMSHHAPDMAKVIGSQAAVVELGSGSSQKTSYLLAELERPVAYVPVEISRDYLEEAAERIEAKFPDLEVLPLHADFTLPFPLPPTSRPVAKRVVYFPGSTIGNFSGEAADHLLQQIARLAGPGGGLLLGFDLVKERHVLEAAYNDTQGITAAFNRNLLARINRELGGTFPLDRFAHRAFFNADDSRIEMHLESLVDQQVTVGSHRFDFRRGETIRTELSHKYRLGEMCCLARQASLRHTATWTDARQYFAVSYFEAE